LCQLTATAVHHIVRGIYHKSARTGKQNEFCEEGNTGWNLICFRQQALFLRRACFFTHPAPQPPKGGAANNRCGTPYLRNKQGVPHLFNKKTFSFNYYIISLNKMGF